MYGQSQPPKVDLSAIRKAKVPIALWAGTEDELSDIDDVRWAISEIEGDDPSESPIVSKNEIEAGQASFLVGEDMSYLEDLVAMVKAHNPVPEWISEEEPVVDLEGVVDKYNPVGN
uniref:Uncharacterized protein n=1 Tax=Strombidium inclinatum TaxID=197538 RepID=A0A7S3MWF5_9SPIT|mmetsp:Transcript_14522/g.22531  ORF Transcript_14522/g.22531 Transcript_14522/m.22531 type:complete len:116 (+) Transcript_14522:640-987(+)